MPVREVIVGRWDERGRPDELHRFVDDGELEDLRRQLVRGDAWYMLDRDPNRPDPEWWLNARGESGSYGFVLVDEGDGRALDRLTPGARDHVLRAGDDRP